MGIESFSSILAQNPIYITSFYLEIILHRSHISYKCFNVPFLNEIFCNLIYSITCSNYSGVTSARSLMFGRVGKLIPACREPALQIWVVLKLNLPTPHAREFNPVFMTQLILLSQTRVEFKTTNAIRKRAVPRRMRNDYRVKQMLPKRVDVAPPPVRRPLPHHSHHTCGRNCFCPHQIGH